MKKQNDKLAARLAAIKSASPAVTEVRLPEAKKRSGRKDREPREPVFRPAKIFLSKSDHMRCVVRNVSDSGAYVHLEGAYPLPPVIVLRFAQTGVIKKARVAWQNETEAGLEYLEDLTPGRESLAG